MRMSVTLFLYCCAFLVAVVRGQNTTTCTRSQADWIRGGAGGDNATLCGVRYGDVLAVDAARLVMPATQAWVLAAHQYCAAALNYGSLVAATPDPVVQALLLVGDSLMASCDNVSQWALNTALTAALSQLLVFNQGGYSGLPTCTPQPSNATATYYYYQQPDMIVLRQLDNTTLAYSVMRGYYNTQLFLCVFSVVAALTIVLLGLWVIMLKSKHKRFVAHAQQDIDVTHLEDRFSAGQSTTDTEL